MSDTTVIHYPLSAMQNQFADIYEKKRLAAAQQAEEAKKQLDTAMRFFHEAEQARDLFLSYIVKEFELPKPKAGYALERIKEREYRLIGEPAPEEPAALPAALPEPEPPAVLSLPEPAPEIPATDTNKG